MRGKTTCRHFNQISKHLISALKLHGDEHPDTAHSYHKIGKTQYELNDYDLALLFFQQANNIWFELYGEEYPITWYI